MSNWCNVRLVVAGTKAALATFSRQTRSRRFQIFTDDMLYGETVKLNSQRMVRVLNRWFHKRYYFQVCADEGFSHFRMISKKYPNLFFLVTYGDPNSGDAGSAYIHCGHIKKKFIFSGDEFEDFLIKNGLPMKKGRPDFDHPNYEENYWEAFWAAEKCAESELLPLIAKPPSK